MYCALCRRPVEGKRQIGAGTIVLAVITGGFWLIAIPFYSKRCSICKSAAVSKAMPDGRSIAATATATARVEGLVQRLSITEGELESTRDELDRLRTERDFYRDLLGDRVHEVDRKAGERTG
jgi:hypothetical protein